MKRPFIAILSISLILNVALVVLLLLELGQKAYPDYMFDLNYKEDSVQIVAEGLVSTQFGERDMSISADGQELYFTQSNFNSTVRAILRSDHDGYSWSEPRIVSFSGQHNDIEPFLAPGGDRLFFASDRPTNDSDHSPDYNIWYVDREGQTWGEPEALDTLINGKGNEFYPAVGNSGNLYFTAILADGVGSEDIYISRFENGSYAKPVPLDTTINSKTYEFNAYINPEETMIIFSSYGRQDDLGGGDLYYSTKGSDGKWQPSVHFEGPINSPFLDYCPFFDIPRGVLYFTSNRSDTREKKSSSRSDLFGIYEHLLNGLDNIYRISAILPDPK